MKVLSTLVLWSLLECVLADYLFEAKIHSYLNPTHRLADGKCCGNDSFVSCEDFCNNRFQFCFLPINFTTTDTLAQCPLGNYTVIGIDDGFVFNQPGRNIFSNPLTFTGYSWSGRFRFFVEVVQISVDGESQSVDNISNSDSVLLSPGEDFIGPLEFQGEHQIGNLEIGFRVMCTNNFFGPNCTSQCSGDECDVESSGFVDDLIPNTTLETDSPATGPRGCKVSFVGCVAGGVSAAVLLLLGVLVIVVFTLFNLRDNQRHASPSHDHPKKDTTDLDYCKINPMAEEWFNQLSCEGRGDHSIKVTSV